MALAAFAIGAAQAQGPGLGEVQRTFLVNGKDVFMVLPPVFVCGPTVRNMAWSPDGTRLAVEREVYEDLDTMDPETLLGLKKSSTEPRTHCWPIAASPIKSVGFSL